MLEFIELYIWQESWLRILPPKRRVSLGREKNLQNMNDVFVSCSDTLSACRLRSKMLAKQLDHVDMEIEREEEAGNV